jgi:hypothetical protein
MITPMTSQAACQHAAGLDAPRRTLRKSDRRWEKPFKIWLCEERRDARRRGQAMSPIRSMTKK